MNRLNFKAWDSPATTTDALFHATTAEIFQLIVNVLRHRAVADDFHQADTLLAALPLATNEFGLAKCRLDNARSYCLAGQYGAALYELRLLVLRLANRRD